MLNGRRLGVIVLLQEQIVSLKNKFQQYDLYPVIASVSPYANDMEAFEKACRELKGKANMILLVCMYTEESRRIVEEKTSLPIILSNALMAKLISKMI
nr:AroM family protein [Caldanaerobacter subterraneus]